MSPADLRASLAKVRNESDFILLMYIGLIAWKHGYQFCWKKVQRAIVESALAKEYDGIDLRERTSDIRRAFGVHGRKGRRVARNIPIGNTEEDYSVVEALCDGGTHVE